MTAKEEFVDHEGLISSTIIADISPDDLKSYSSDADDEITSSYATKVSSTHYPSTTTETSMTESEAPCDNNTTQQSSRLSNNTCSSVGSNSSDNQDLDHNAAPIKEEAVTTNDISATPLSQQQQLCPSMWSISYQQLIDFHNETSIKFGSSKYSIMTMRDINEQIIEPSCQRAGVSLALQLNPQGCKVGAFVTHSWDEPFSDFVESIQQVFHTWATKPNLWICSFALLQGDDSIIDDQLGATIDSPLEEAPFMKALEKASCFVVVRNATTDVYSRIWCVCELMYAKKIGLVPTHTLVTGSSVFAESTTSCLDAMSTNPKDKARIFKLLLNEFQYQEIDEFVQKFRQQEEAPAAFSRRITIDQNDDDSTDHEIEQCLSSCVVSVCGKKIPRQLFLRVWLIFTLIVGIHSLFKVTHQKHKSTEKHSRIDEVKAFLISKDISNPSHLDSFGSPQNMAMTWIADHDIRNVDIGDKFFLQRYVLAVFYYATEGDKWMENLGWLDKNAESDWYGINDALTVVENFETNDVFSIDLESNKLRGSLPLEIFRLTGLKSLLLNDNFFTGTISAKLSNLYNLEHFWIQDNDFKGFIPSELWSMSNITDLSTHSNSLSGVIPKNSLLCQKQPKDVYIAMDCKQCPDSKSSADSGPCCDTCWEDYSRPDEESSERSNLLGNREPPYFLGAVGGVDITIGEIESFRLKPSYTPTIRPFYVGKRCGTDDYKPNSLSLN